MIQTLAVYFSLEISYKMNSILYHLRKLPLIKRVFAGKSYDMNNFKAIIKVFAILNEIIGTILYKALYLLMVIGFVLTSFGIGLVNDSAPIAPMFLHVLTCWTLVGAILNNHVFENNDNSYYAIVLLRMDAKKYALTNYAYTLFKHFTGLMLCMLLFSVILKLPYYYIILYPLYVVGIKVFVQALVLLFYDRIENQKAKFVTAVQISQVVLYFIISLLFPVSSLLLPNKVVICIMVAGIILGIVSCRVLLKYDNYTLAYKHELCEYRSQIENATDSTGVVSYRAALDDTVVSVSGKKSGFAYMNDLFVKRHRKLLWRMEIIMTAVAALLFVAVIAVISFGSSAEDMADINHTVLYVAPRVLVFIMYGLNRGMEYTQALYINCDHSLLTYSFYKERKSILKLFAIRLAGIIKINLPVAAVIGIGLDILLYISGGTSGMINYGVLIVAPVCLSIFFSVHYLFMYYIMQPFDAETKLTNPIYSLVKNITYIVCFSTFQLDFESLYFGIGTIIFCVLYCIIACTLVYIFAPKTFRIRH